MDPVARVKCEEADPEYYDESLKFSSSGGVDFRKAKLTRQDPMSHRVIEKRRRDRMNNCLADLSRLIPPEYLKKGRGRIEKTEIIEMAIKHLKYLQERANCAEQIENGTISIDHFRTGYQECLSEVMRYLVECQGHFPRDALCVQLINHLQEHCDKLIKGDAPKQQQRCNPVSNSSSSCSSSHYAMHNQSNGMQRIKRKSAEINGSKRHHQQAFKAQSDDKLRSSEIDSPEEIINDCRDIYSEQYMSPQVNNNNYIQMDLVESNPDDGGGGRNRGEFTEKNQSEMPDVPNSTQTDHQGVQDLRMPAQYQQPLSPSYQARHRRWEQNYRAVAKSESSQPGDSGLSLGSNQGETEHLYKFKSTIKQRFSQSQSTDYFSSSPSEVNSYNRSECTFARSREIDQSRYYDAGQYQISSSETNSSENITSVSQNSYNRSGKESEMKGGRKPQEKEYHKSNQTKVARHKMGENFANQAGIGVPIFALHAKGSFYIPMNVEYESLIPFLGPYDLLDSTAPQPNITLHPVTISVNFQPAFFTIKQMPSFRSKPDHKDWQ